MTSFVLAWGMIYIFFLMASISSPAVAQIPVKVIKAVGKTITVEAASEGVKEGESMFLTRNPGADESLFFSIKEAGRRVQSVGFNLGYSSLKTSSGTDGKIDSFAIQLKYSRNWGSFELGGLIGYQTTNATTQNSKDLTTDLGLIAEWNFVKNQSPNTLVPAMTFEIIQSSGSSSTDEDSSSPSGQRAFFGPTLKWFPTIHPFCVRTSLGYHYEKASLAGLSTSAAGPQLTSGFQVYF